MNQKLQKTIKIDADTYERLYALRDRITREDLPPGVATKVLQRAATNGGYTLGGMVDIGLDLLEAEITPVTPAAKPRKPRATPASDE